MYKIYYDTKCLCLSDKDMSMLLVDGGMYSTYDSTESLKVMVDVFLKSKDINTFHIQAINVEKLYLEFCSLFKVIEAAGGVVKNKDRKILFICRNGKWDLPKGKIEKGESKEVASIREVEEECGITGIELLKEITSTHHIYFTEKNRVLKKTYWFEMVYNGKGKGTPQHEEGISEVRWVGESDLSPIIAATFPSIFEVMVAYHQNIEIS